MSNVSEEKQIEKIREIVFGPKIDFYDKKIQDIEKLLDLKEQAFTQKFEDSDANHLQQKEINKEQFSIFKVELQSELQELKDDLDSFKIQVSDAIKSVESSFIKKDELSDLFLEMSEKISLFSKESDLHKKILEESTASDLS